MEKVIILGTGNAGVKNCYNTCFALKNKNEYLLVAARTGKDRIIPNNKYDCYA